MNFLLEIEEILEQEEKNENCKIIVFYGKNGYFCTGMDFKSYVSNVEEDDDRFKEMSQKKYMGLLHRIALYPKIVVSIVEGEAIAGGVGIAVASDLLFASENSRFGLSEALWGLIPSMLMPYLIRRIGYQSAYRMTLTTLPIDINEAKRIRLIDDSFTDRSEIIRKYFSRLVKLNIFTVWELKKYMRNLWIIDEEMELQAIEKTTQLAGSDMVRMNIERFVNEKRFPWE